MVEQIVVWLTDLVKSIGYLGVGLSMFIESFFVPIPSELIMPFAGFVASTGEMNLYLVILIGGISSYLGSLPFYYIGYLGNRVVVDVFLKKYGKYFFIKEEEVDRGFEIFNKYGNSFVLFGRIVPIIRSVISFPAGVAKMNFFQFSLYTLIGSTLWSALLATLGYVLGENWKDVGYYIAQYENVILYVGLLFLVGLILYRLIRRNK